MMKALILLMAVVLVGCGKKPAGEQQREVIPKGGTSHPEPQADKKKPGTVLWEFETGDGATSSPAIGSDGTVYVGSMDGKLYAIKTDSKGLA